MKNTISFFLRVSFITSITCILFFEKIFFYLKFLVEIFISTDGTISQDGIQIIRFHFYFFITTLFIIGLFNFSIFKNTFNNFLKEYLDYTKIYESLFEDYHKKYSHSVLSFFFINLISFLVIILYFFLDNKKEGLLETLSAIIFLASSIMLLFSFLLIKNNKIILDKKKKISYSILFFALIIFFIFGEELSWGQRYFSIDPNSFFENYNFQQEVNIHNFFNPLHKIFYLIFSLLLAVFCFSIWIFSHEKKPDYQIILEPNKNLSVLVFLLLYAAGYDGELFEILFSLFCFFYSSRIILLIKHLQK